MAKDGAMPDKDSRKDQGMRDDEEFLFNDEPGKDLMKEYNRGNNWKSLRYGENARDSNGKSMPHLKPVFGTPSYDDPLDTGGENLN